MPHGSHIYAKAYDMAKATMFAYPQSYHALPNWKCIMRYCAKYPGINIPDQETYDQYSDTSQSICFHIYLLITRCSTHGRLPLTAKNIFRKCKHDYASEQSTKICTRKELVIIKTILYNLHTSFYIPSIQKLAFHIPRVQILVTNHFGEYYWTAFKIRKSFQDVLCCRDYAERVVASFPHQIQSEYYGGNISVYIKGIALEQFNELTQIEINSSTKSCPHHASFHFFCWMIAKNMLPILLHTVNVWLDY